MSKDSALRTIYRWYVCMGFISVRRFLNTDELDERLKEYSKSRELRI